MGTKIALAIATLALAASSAKAVNPNTIVKPNIVVFMADDLNRRLLQDALAQGWMPKLQEKIIAPGTTFNGFHVSYPLCCPSRASYQTGQYPQNHDVWSNAPIPPWPAPSPVPGGVTAFNHDAALAPWLQAAGYRTGHFGKHLNGYGTNDNLNDVRDDPDWVPPGYTEWAAVLVPADPDDGTGGQFDYTLNVNGDFFPYGHTEADYQTDVLATRAADFINASESQHDAEPLYIFLSFGPPHFDVTPHCYIHDAKYGTIRPAPRYAGSASNLNPVWPVSFDEVDRSDKPPYVANNDPLTDDEKTCLTEVWRAKMESLRAIDDAIGTVFAALETNNETGNLVAIFTSDHGEQIGEHGLVNKEVPYSESVQAPLYVRAPGFTAGQVSPRFVTMNDLAPTLVAWAQATPTVEPDGRSIEPLLASPMTTTWRRNLYVVERSGSCSGWSSVRTSSLSTQAPNMTYTEYKNASCVVYATELYDEALDPFELNSVHAAASYATRKAYLAGLLASLKTCAGTTCQTAEDQ